MNEQKTEVKEIDAETTKSRSQEKISDSADPQKMKVRNDHEGDN